MNLSGLPHFLLSVPGYLLGKLRHRLALKIIAFCLAILLCLIAEAEKQAQRESEKIDRAFLVELSVLGPGEGLAVLDLPSSIEVRASAPMGEAWPADLKGSIDLRGYQAGAVAVPVAVSLPKGWVLVEVRPQVVHLNIEATLSRSFFVTFVIPGRIIDEQTGTTTTIQSTVQGPESRIKQVRAVLGLYNPDHMGPVDVRLTPVDRDGQPVRGVQVYPQWVRLQAPPFQSDGG